MKQKEGTNDKKVAAIDTEEAFSDPMRVSEIVRYILEHFDQKTKRSSFYSLEGKRTAGFNSIFAVASIPMAKKYYTEFKRQLAVSGRTLCIATIFSFSPNEEDPEDALPDEDFDTESLDKSSRDFLDAAIADYNKTFKVDYDTSSDKFQNYYKDLSDRVKNRQVDLLIVVNMFLTGFDATTLNTLWVDKNLRQHGLIQAFSRTNRILNSVKTFGNIICFRDLKQATDDAIALFGDKEAGGIVLLKTYDEYYNGYDENGEHKSGYAELIAELTELFPLGQPIIGEEAQKNFIRLYGTILKLKNILSAFDDFEGNEILPDRDFQDYQSVYIDLYQEFTKDKKADKENINDDIIFEIELIKQIEVNIDYILMLVAKYHETNCADKSILVTIDKAVNSSIQLRSKKELIEHFIAQVNTDSKVDDDWRKFVQEQKENDISAIIAGEQLKSDETRKFIENSFRDGTLKVTGTDIDKILPPVSRFSSGGGRMVKKQSVINKLLMFFEKYLGLV
jgi:type I restriction enzyme R subunit